MDTAMQAVSVDFELAVENRRWSEALALLTPTTRDRLGSEREFQSVEHFAIAFRNAGVNERSKDELLVYIRDKNKELVVRLVTDKVATMARCEHANRALRL
jgi:hypothetical protein